MTEWPEIDDNCKAPFLASYGITAANWPVKREQPCVICNVYGESDHNLGHCLFVFSCCDRGRMYFGVAKAAERAKALHGTAVRSVRDLSEVTEDSLTVHAMNVICELGGIDEDDDATAYTDLCTDMERFCGHVCSITGPTADAPESA
jgi:hypothetical protein